MYTVVYFYHGSHIISHGPRGVFGGELVVTSMVHLDPRCDYGVKALFSENLP